MRANLLLAGLLLLAAPLATAQMYDDAQDEERARAQRERPLPPAGFWPTDRMIELFIDRWVEDDYADQLDFDQDQIFMTQELLKERLPEWLHEHRPEIMQLSNEWFEALLAKEPPDPLYVADWAQRALPVLNDFADMAEGVTGEMRDYMTEDQRVLLDGQMAAFRVGVNFMTQRLGGWSEGRFDPENEWFGNPEARRVQREREAAINAEMESAKRDAMGLPPESSQGAAAAAGGAQPAEQSSESRALTTATEDEWKRYVDEFIRRYQLNEEQQAEAYRILRSVQEQRDGYLRRVSPRLDQVSARLAAASSDEEKQRIEEQAERLKRPLERMFTILRERLEPLPTRKQRSEALAREKTATPQPAERGGSSNP